MPQNELPCASLGPWFITFRLIHKDDTMRDFSRSASPQKMRQGMIYPFLLLCLFLWSAYKIGGVELWMPVLLARNVMNHAPTAHALSYSIDLWFGDFYPYCLQLSKKTFIFRCRCFTLAGIYKQQPRAMLPMQRWLGVVVKAPTTAKRGAPWGRNKRKGYGRNIFW